MSILTFPSASTVFASVKASDLGCALDCDLATGLSKTGGAATDDTALITDYLSAATALNPLQLILDGAALITGLNLPAAGHWSIVGIGLDSGFYMAAGSNTDVIRNGPGGPLVNDPGTSPAPARGTNVHIENLFINGNRGDGHSGNATTGDARGYDAAGDQWFFGINLISLDNIVIRNIRCFNVSAYNVRLSNCGHWIVQGSRFENVLPGQPVLPQNADGLHISGPANDGRISNCHFRAGDDAMALNGPEGCNGLIERIAITNCTSYQSQTMLRMYADSARGIGNVKDVVVSNYVGSANVVGFLFGIEDAHPRTAGTTVTNVSFTNCSVEAPIFACGQDNMGDIVFDNCRSINPTQGYGMFQTSIVGGGAFRTIVIDSLTFTNCMVIQANGTNGAGVFDAFSGGLFNSSGPVTVNKLKVNGFAYLGATAPGLLMGGTIDRFQGDAIDTSTLTHLTDPNAATTITTRAGYNSTW